MRQRLAEFARLRQARLARPVEETLEDIRGWLPQPYWAEVEASFRSEDSSQVELPSDFLPIFKRMDQEAAIEAARRYEHEMLEHLRCDHSGLQ